MLGATRPKIKNNRKAGLANRWPKSTALTLRVDCMEEPEARVTSPLFMFRKKIQEGADKHPRFRPCSRLGHQKKSRIYAKFGFENPLVPSRGSVVIQLITS
jgi:hypothetical protein